MTVVVVVIPADVVGSVVDVFGGAIVPGTVVFDTGTFTTTSFTGK